MAAYIEQEGDPDEELFDLCAAFLRQTQIRDTDEKLSIYGLYKQVTVGDVNTSRPGFFDFAGQAKWDAWNACKGKSEDEARTEYIQLVLKQHGEAFQAFCEAGEPSEAPSGQEGDGGTGAGTLSMALSVSTLGGSAVATTVAEASEESAGALMTEEEFDGLAGSAAKGDLPGVRKLLGEGAPLESKDQVGRTALHWAVEAGHKEVVDELVLAGADVNAADTDGSTPLHIACLCDHVEIVKALLAAGADRTIQDSEGDTPLSIGLDAGAAELRALFAAAEQDCKEGT